MPHRRRWQHIGRGIRTAQADLLSLLLIFSPAFLCQQAVQVTFVNKIDAHQSPSGASTYRFARGDLNKSNGLLAFTLHWSHPRERALGVQYKACKGEAG
jgi:hypothetical protein